uniref:Uncharacterized protein n=1 Tax=Oryza rufipogon TaxID=4529 RepID=A0A0E0NJ16_ORYRU
MAPHAPVSSRAGCHRREIAGAPPRLTPAVSEPPAAVPDRAGHAGCAEPRLCLARRDPLVSNSAKYPIL